MATATPKTLAVAFRLPDATVVCQERSTLPMPPWFRNARLYERDVSFVEAYLELGRKGGAIDGPLRPAGHGLLLFDLRDYEIHSMQTAVDFASMEASWFGRFVNPQYLGLARGLIAAGRLRHRTRYGNAEAHAGPSLDETGMLEVGRRVYEGRDGPHDGEAAVTEDFLIDVAPFVRFDYSLDAGGLALMRRELGYRGFGIGEDWDEWTAPSTVDKAEKPAKRKRAAS